MSFRNDIACMSGEPLLSILGPEIFPGGAAIDLRLSYPILSSTFPSSSPLTPATQGLSPPITNCLAPAAPLRSEHPLGPLCTLPADVSAP